MKKQRVIKYSTFLKYSESKRKEILHRIGLEERRTLMKVLTSGIVTAYPQTSVRIDYGRERRILNPKIIF